MDDRQQRAAPPQNRPPPPQPGDTSAIAPVFFIFVAIVAMVNHFMNSFHFVFQFNRFFNQVLLSYILFYLVCCVLFLAVTCNAVPVVIQPY